MAIEVGRQAPDFGLKDQHNVELRLAEFRGRHVVLVFYPLAFTGVCAGELTGLQEELAAFQNERVQVLAVSVDSPYALRTFADQQGVKFPLLSDFWPHGAVAQTYGVFDERVGVALRGTFVIDSAGVVRWRVVNDIPHARDRGDYHRALAAL